jgi:demethylmenaquinone methyltransferase/2-methoxy-6-polyprenyl-1,4-benzoquinol methylase
VSLQTAFDSPERKRSHVRRLFATIADRYDVITIALSCGQDSRWKRRLTELAGVREGERALDLACGTGDIALLLRQRGGHVVGLDVTYRMLQLARAKTPGDPLRLVTGDMMALPFASATFDLVTTGYGLRNVPALAPAVEEAARVLKPGGRMLSLDFNRPENPAVRAAYLGYLWAVGGALGWLLHRDPETYRYIPESIRRYPGATGVARLLAAGGFADVQVVPLLGGLMSLHVARRAAGAGSAVPC